MRSPVFAFCFAFFFAVVVACSGCLGAVSGPCVLPDCPDGFTESDDVCGADEDEADCVVVEGGVCGGQVHCRPGADGE